MNINDFKKQIYKLVDNAPNCWRRGQSVFNVIEEHYGEVARHVQFVDGVDCFYNDSLIDTFIFKCYCYLKERNII